MNKLYLLDAYALIYRAYYALIRTPRINSKGFNTSAIYGFVNTLEEIKKLEPTHLAVAFDPKEAKLSATNSIRPTRHKGKSLPKT